MIKLIFFLLSLAIFSVSYYSSAKNSSEAISINEEMKKISAEIQSIVPFLASESAFADKKNETTISTVLSNLESLFVGLKLHPEISSTGFSINRTTMLNQIRESRRIFNGPKKDFARHKLNSSLGLCISCHEQLPKTCQLKVMNETEPHQQIDSFEKAEFLFTTREYNDSLKFYDDYIRSFKSNGTDVSKLQNALNRKLSYYTRVNCSFDNGIKSFQEDLKNPNLPQSIREQIASWEKELAKDKPWEKFTGQTASEKEMRIFLDKFVKPINKNAPIIGLFSHLEVSDLIISGILYEFLNANPKSKLVPETLYWLAKLDKRLNYSIFYSLGDFYLHECMEKHSKSTFSKKCYKEYEDDIIFSYTGSSGTELPPEVKIELQELRKKVGLKK